MYTNDKKNQIKMSQKRSFNRPLQKTTHKV
jgi:hypothetical protein